jgi:hypothetical protein
MRQIQRLLYQQAPSTLTFVVQVSMMHLETARCPVPREVPKIALKACRVTRTLLAQTAILLCVVFLGRMLPRNAATRALQESIQHALMA